MKQHIDTIILLVVTCMTLSGCAYPVAGIISPGVDRTVFVKSSSRYSNVLLHVDEKNKTLRYMTRNKTTEDNYLIRTYDFDGHLLVTTTFPKFREYGWADCGYGACQGGAISPDCSSVAYLDIKGPSETNENDLCYFNKNTGERKVLAKKLAKDGNDLAWLWWVSDRDLLVGVDGYQKPDARLMLIDVKTSTVKLDFLCKNLQPSKFALSHSKRYLAYWEGIDRYESRGPFRILDLHEMKEVAATELGIPALYGAPKWSMEDDALAFIMDDKLMRFSLASKKSEVLKSLPTQPNDPSSWFELHDYQGKRLYYSADVRNSFVIRLQCFDLATGQDIQFKNHPEGSFNVFVCSDGTIIYYILGQEPLH
ncbi:MAG: hypothetical protein A2283_13300 [Lentisphaerae bacterium RIFOXYA12_FULL_48_11]|nr:MAG: hypothetical protein A2283_13300 [Lentisphaerae bacterium RIFOXYA12_FULL_48_11]